MHFTSKYQKKVWRGWGQNWGGAAPQKFSNDPKHYLEKIPLRFFMQQQNLNFMHETIS